MDEAKSCQQHGASHRWLKAGNQIYVLWHAWLFHDSNLSFVGGITWDTCVPVTCEYYYCSLTFSAHIKKFLMCLAVVANGDYYARKAFQSYCLVYMDIALNRITKNYEREVVSNKRIKAKCWLKFLLGDHGLGPNAEERFLWGFMDFWVKVSLGNLCGFGVPLTLGSCPLALVNSEMRRLTCCLAHLTQFAWVAEERCALWSGKGRRGAVFLAVGYYYRRLWWLALRCQVIYFSKNGLHLPLLQCLGCLLKLICCSVEGHDVWQLVDLSQRVWVYHLMYNF